MLQHVEITPVKTRSSDDRRWQSVVARDGAADGTFVYAVSSTGVFCRPGCPSRRPRRDRVRFFDTARAAEHAGFRACLRCKPTTDESPIANAVRRAATYLEHHVDQTVSLRTLASAVGLSVSHLQRQFTRALGVSPREYHAACRANRFRRELRSGRDVTTALYEAGYGSPSRVYEAPTGRGISPARYRRGGEGIAIQFTVVPSPLGRLLVAATEKGICAVKLGADASALEAELRAEFPAATIARDHGVRSAWVTAVVDRLSGSQHALALPLDVRGTAFQWRVWHELQRIPHGETRAYSDVARAIGRPSAVRAVARACAANPAAIVVPCHRVVGKGGKPTGYRWGIERKQRLLALEAGSRQGRTRKAK